MLIGKGFSPVGHGKIRIVPLSFAECCLSLGHTETVQVAYASEESFLGIGIASRCGEIVRANAAEISALRLYQWGAEERTYDKAEQGLYWANRHVQTS